MMDLKKLLFRSRAQKGKSRNTPPQPVSVTIPEGTSTTDPAFGKLPPENEDADSPFNALYLHPCPRAYIRADPCSQQQLSSVSTIFRVVLIGAPSTGKSSLFQRMQGKNLTSASTRHQVNRLYPSSAHSKMPTRVECTALLQNPVDVAKVLYRTARGTPVAQLELWDVNSNLDEVELQAYMRGAKVLLLLFDVTRVEETLPFVMNVAHGAAADTFIIFIGNFLDRWTLPLGELTTNEDNDHNLPSHSTVTNLHLQLQEHIQSAIPSTFHSRLRASSPVATGILDPRTGRETHPALLLESPDPPNKKDETPSSPSLIYGCGFPTPVLLTSLRTCHGLQTLHRLLSVPCQLDSIQRMETQLFNVWKLLAHDYTTIITEASENLNNSVPRCSWSQPAERNAGVLNREEGGDSREESTDTSQNSSSTSREEIEKKKNATPTTANDQNAQPHSIPLRLIPRSQKSELLLTTRRSERNAHAISFES